MKRHTKTKFRLREYSILAGSLLLGSTVDAQISYRNIDPDTTVMGTIGIEGIYDLDFDGDGNREFSLRHFTETYSRGVRLIGGGAANAGAVNTYAGGFGCFTYYLFNEMPYGDTVGSSDNFKNGGALVSSTTYYNCYGLTYDGYLGVRFDLADGTHFGWIRLNAQFTGFTVKEFAYRLDPNVPIIVGDKPPEFLGTYPDTVVTGSAVACETTIEYPPVKAIDGFPGVDVTQVSGLPSGANFPFGNTTNTFVATDAYGSMDTLSFIITVNYPPAGPEDNCPSAVTLPGPGVYTAFTGGATSTGLTSTCAFNDVVDSWYEYYIPSGLDTLRIYTCASNYDTGLSLWDSCAGSEIVCNDNGAIGGGSSCGDSDLQSMIELSGSALSTVEGSIVLIRLSGIDNSSGCGELVVEEINACNASVPPASFTAYTSAGNINFEWDPVPQSVGCQLQAGPLGGSFPWKVNLPDSEVSDFSLPASLVPTGNYHARVLCACSISPLVLTGPSNTDLFAVSSPRIGEKENVSIAPNPAKDVLNLIYLENGENELSLRITNMLGKVLLEQKSSISLGINTINLDLGELPSGLYFLSINDGKKVTTRQFEIVK